MRAKSLAGFAALLVALTSVGSCGGGGGEKEAATPAGEAAAPVGEPAGRPATTSLPGTGSGGYIQGSIRLEGTPPATTPLNMGADPYCKAQHAAAPASESLVVGAGGALRHVFVYVKAGLPAGQAYAAPSEPVVLDQVGCQYRPHVFGIMVGQPLRIQNSDGTLHNVHSLSRNTRAFNVGLPDKGQHVMRSFSAEEIMVRIKCDVHPWMECWAGVLPHPFFAVSGDGGAFAIEDVPPGTYTLEAWHEKLGAQTQSVTVETGRPVTVDFAFQAAALGDTNTEGRP